MWLAAAAAFNLVCSGTQTIVDDVGKEVKTYLITYRVDLDRGIYCEQDCKEQRRLADVQPTTLYLHREKDDDPVNYKDFTEQVDRETGAHRVYRRTRSGFAGWMTLERGGRCERAAFTGLPKFETKF